MNRRSLNYFRKILDRITFIIGAMLYVGGLCIFIIGIIEYNRAIRSSNNYLKNISLNYILLGNSMLSIASILIGFSFIDFITRIQNIYKKIMTSPIKK